MRIDFETWFTQQDFYTNLRFNLGDRIFDFDNSVNAYRALHVQIAWETWQHLHETLLAFGKETFEKWFSNYPNNIEYASRQIAWDAFVEGQNSMRGLVK